MSRYAAAYGGTTMEGGTGKESQIASALAGGGWSDTALVIAGILPIQLPGLEIAQIDIRADHTDTHVDSNNPGASHDDYHNNYFSDHSDHSDHNDTC
jgi:hypothetical protein